MRMYVGNLPYQITEEEMRSQFESFGQVTSVTIIKDKFSGQSKGFGFVEMSNDQEARQAMTGLDGTDFKGRKLTVNEARPMTERRDGGGGGGGGRDRDRDRDRGPRGGGGGGGGRGGRW